MHEVPFIKLLKWHKFCYFFDVNKNQMLKVTADLYQELEREQNGIMEEHSREYEELREMGFLSANKVLDVYNPMADQVEELLANEVSQLTLQITQDCNFRCSYCIYSDINNEVQRHHEKKNMSFATAKKAVDYLFQHSGRTERLSIGFYGGEPLLNFSVVKQVVEYAEPLLAGRDCQFAMTSNCSLMTPEIQEYLHNHNFSLVISMDGPERIQNINRRFAVNGKGSYEAVISRVRRIKEKDRKWFKDMVGLSMVIDPRNDYDEICEIFNEFDENASINAVAISDSYSLQKTYYVENFLWKQRYHQFLALLEEIRGEKILGVSREARQMIDSLKKDKVQYMPLNGLPARQTPSGPCVPGQTKLFVSVVGELFPCERVNEASPCMKLGTLDEGIDIHKVKKMMNFAAGTSETCKNCWAFLHCDHCLRHIENNDRIFDNNHLQFCPATRKRIEDTLSDFAALQEIRRLGGEKR